MFLARLYVCLRARSCARARLSLFEFHFSGIVKRARLATKLNLYPYGRTNPLASNGHVNKLQSRDETRYAYVMHLREL